MLAGTLRIEEEATVRGLTSTARLYAIRPIRQTIIRETNIQHNNCISHTSTCYHIVSPLEYSRQSDGYIRLLNPAIKSRGYLDPGNGKFDDTTTCLEYHVSRRAISADRDMSLHVLHAACFGFDRRLRNSRWPRTTGLDTTEAYGIRDGRVQATEL